MRTKIKQKKIIIRIPKKFCDQMLLDLRRPHPFATERAGFLYAKTVYLDKDLILVICTDYIPIEDSNYIYDPSVGAKINAEAIRLAMQGTIDRQAGCFHVHLHEHFGKPNPSSTDEAGLRGVVDSFANVASKHANGIIILSKDSFYSSIKLKGERNTFDSNSISVIGYPMKFENPLNAKIDRQINFSRQSFLGHKAHENFKNVRIGIVGYGGGGSHIGQQLAHIGFKKVIVFDDDIIEYSNLNRLVGAWYVDIKKAIKKIDIAKRVIKKISPSTELECVDSQWQMNTKKLQECDIIIGCVDSYTQRQQLESECRRYLIPYIDIGMDVNKANTGSFSISGQVILSMPGFPCMSCLGYLTEEKINIQAAKYGDAGESPQVIWPNGVLASTAIGILVDLLSGWTLIDDRLVYLSYDGNNCTISDHVRLKFVASDCLHFPLNESGPPIFIKL